MNLTQACSLIEKECKAFTNKLAKKGVPIEQIDVDLDDVGLCEPFIHLHINLDNEWFYNEIEKGSLQYGTD